MTSRCTVGLRCRRRQLANECIIDAMPVEQSRGPHWAGVDRGPGPDWALLGQVEPVSSLVVLHVRDASIGSKSLDGRDAE